MKHFILKLSFLYFSVASCAPTYFAPGSVIKAFDGRELTSESCTQEQIDYLKLLQEGSQKDSDVHDLGADMYLLMSKGHTLSGAWLNKINRVWKEHDSLQHRANSEGESNLMPEIIELDKNSFRVANQHIRIFEEAIDLLESSNINPSITSSNKRELRILSEHNKLSAILTSLIAKYFGHLVDFCQFFTKGYQLTERGGKLAGHLNLLNRDYNNLLNKRIQKGTSQMEKQITIKKQLQNIIKDILYIQEKIKKEFVKADSLQD